MRYREILYQGLHRPGIVFPDFRGRHGAPWANLMSIYFPAQFGTSNAVPTTRSRAMRYAVVGLIAFMIDLGMLLLLAPVVPLIVANTIAFLVANGANFLAGHLWVFRRTAHEPDLVAKYAATLVISLVGLALNNAFLWIGVVVLGISVALSKIATTLMVWGWNYWARAVWVYSRN